MPTDYREFAKTVKSKYPQYKDVDDLELAQKMVEKFPEYKSKVTFDEVKKKESTSKGTGLLSKQEDIVSSLVTKAKKEQKPSGSSASGKPDKNVFTGYPGKEDKRYKLDSSTGAPVWKEEVASLKTVNGKRLLEFQDKPITNPSRVVALNKQFNQNASTDVNDNVFTGYPGKELNEYKIENNTWKRRLPGQTKWIDLNQKNTIDALNYQFKKDVKYSPAKAKFDLLTEDEDAESKRDLDGKLTSVNSKLIGGEEENAVKKLKEQFPLFQFIEQGMLTDEILVIAPNDKKIKISLDNWTHDDDLNQSSSLREFIKANSASSLNTKEEKMLEAQRYEDQFKIKPVDVKIKLGEGVGDGENLMDLTGSGTSIPLPEKDIMTANIDAKLARSEYFKERKETFQEINDKHRQSIKTTGGIDNKDVRNAYANLNNDTTIAKSLGSYMNDIADENKSITKEYESLKAYSNQIKDKVASGEISEEDFKNIYAPKIEENIANIEKRSSTLNDDLITAKANENSINKSIAENLIINSAKGSVGGGISNNLVTGLTDILRIGAGIAGAKSEDTKALQKALVEQIVGSGTTEEYMASEDRNALTKTLFSLSKSMGQLATGSAAGKLATSIGAGTGAVNLASTLPFYAGGYYEMRDQFEGPEFADVSDAEKVLMSTLYGTASGILEKYGLTKSLSKTPIGKGFTNTIIKAAFKDVPKNASAKMIEVSIENSIKKQLVSRGANTVGAYIVEASTEAAQELTQIGLQEAFEVVKDNNYFDNGTGWDIASRAWEAAYLGGLGGAVMGTVSQSYGMFKDRKKINSIDSIELMKLTYNDANMRDLMLTNIKTKIINKEITPKEGKDMFDAVKNTAAILDKLPDNLSDEQTLNSVNLLVERSNIEKEIAGKDENLVATQKARVAEINNQLKNISENATKESNIQEVTAEGGVSEYQGAGEGQQEVGIGEGSQRDTTVDETNLGDSNIPGQVQEEVTAKQVINRPSTLSEFGGIKFDTPLQGDTYIEGQQVVFEDRATGRVYELGNVDEVMDSPVAGLNVQPETVSVTNEGKISVDGSDWNIQSELPTMGIEYNPVGEVQRVSLKDDNGNTTMFDGQKAVDIAYQIELQKIQSPEQQQLINDLLEQDEEFKSATADIKLAEAPVIVQEEAAPDTEQAAQQAEVVIDKPTITTNSTTEVDRVKNVAPESEDGATFNIDGSTYTGGGLVVPVISMNTTAEELTPEMIADFVEEHKDKIGDNDTVKVGIYKFPNSNQVSIDLNIIAPDSAREQAIEFGKNAGQESLFDLGTFENVKTGATGENPVSFTNEQLKEIAKAFKEGRMPNVFDQTTEADIQQEVDAIGEFISGTDEQIDQQVSEVITDKRMAKIVARARKALSRILPGVKFKVYKTNEEYKAATEESINESSGGTFDANTNTIHINLSLANAKTVAHEVFHAILINKVRTNAAAAATTKRMIQAIASKIDNNPSLKAYLDNFASQYEENIQNEEKLSELVGALSEYYMDASETIKDIIFRWIDKIAKMFKLDPFNRNETYDMLNTIARKVAKGRVISKADVSPLIEGVVGEISVSEKVDKRKSIAGDIIRFDINNNTKTEENVPLSRFNGKKTNVFESDRMTGGYIAGDSGAVLFNFLGGVQFPAITGKWWASKDKTKASNLAKNANSNRDADGYIYGTPMVGSDKQHMSNNDMLVATLELMKLDANSKKTKINKLEVIRLINKAFETKNTKLKKSILVNVTKKSNNVSNVFNELEYVLFQDGKYIVDRNNKPILDDNGSSILNLTFDDRKAIVETLLGNASVRDVNFPSAGNAFEAAKRFEEPITQKVKKIGDVVTVMRTKGTLKWKKTETTDEFYHKSYPYEIYAENPDGTMAEIEMFILDSAYSMRDIFPSLTKSSGESFSWDDYFKKHGPKSEKVAEAQYNRTAKLSYASGEIKTEEDQASTRKQLSPEVSSKLTDDGKGNFVFHHYSNQKRDVIKPGTGENIITGKEEGGALSAVGGLAMYYTMDNQVEPGVGNVQHTVLVPNDKVYDFNKDPEGFYDEAKKRFEAARPSQSFGNPNYQLAFITQVANENGYDMVVAKWRNNELRAQTTIPIEPAKENIPMQPVAEETYKVGDDVEVYGSKSKVISIDGDTITYKGEGVSGDINFKRFPKNISKQITPRKQVVEDAAAIEESMEPRKQKPSSDIPLYKYGNKITTTIDQDKPISVLPLPERFMNGYEEATGKSVSKKDKESFLYKLGRDHDYKKGGVYIDISNRENKDTINGYVASSGEINIDPNTGKPSLNISENIATDEEKSKGRIIKTNLFKKKAGWEWNSDSDKSRYPKVETLVSVEVGSKHVYTLGFKSTTPIQLKNYSESKSEPRLRPTTKGQIFLGDYVGTINIRGKKHPVYDNVYSYDQDDYQTLDRLNYKYLKPGRLQNFNSNYRDETYNELKYNPSVTLKDRLTDADQYIFDKLGIKNAKYISGGVEASVYDIGMGKVIRISKYPSNFSNNIVNKKIEGVVPVYSTGKVMLPKRMFGVDSYSGEVIKVGERESRLNEPKPLYYSILKKGDSLNVKEDLNIILDKLINYISKTLNKSVRFSNSIEDQLSILNEQELDQFKNNLDDNQLRDLNRIIEIKNNLKEIGVKQRDSHTGNYVRNLNGDLEAIDFGFVIFEEGSELPNTEEKNIIRNQQPGNLNGIITTLRAKGFSDAAITQYLKNQGYTAAQINSAMVGPSIGTMSLDEIFAASDQEIKNKLRKKSIKGFFISLIKTTIERQTEIKRALSGIKNKTAKLAMSKLITKAGASGLASLRFKRVSKEIYGGLKEPKIKILDKIIYARRIMSINENRAKRGLKPYRGMGGYSEVNSQLELDKIRREIGDVQFDDLNNRAKKYFDVFKDNLKKLKDSGRINQETYDNLNDIDYSPIATIKYIISDNSNIEDMDREASRLGISKQDINRLTDENENGIITDSRFLLAMNISAVEARAFENGMLNDVVEAMKTATAIEKNALSQYVIFDNPVIGTFKDGRPKRKYDDQTVPSGFRKVHYFKNGVDMYMVVRDDIARQLLDVKNSKLVANIEETAKNVPVIGTVLKHIVLTPARILRFMATGGNPLFIFGNVAVDLANATFNTSVYSWFKPYALVQAGAGFTKNFLKKAVTSDTLNKSYNEYAEHGGLLEFLSNEGMRSLNDLKPGFKIFTPIHKLMMMYGSVMSYIGETSEVATRLAVYDKTKKNLIAEFKKENVIEPNAEELDAIMWEAARQARELIDFNQGGSWAKEVDVVMPYLNASLQGFRKPIEYAKNNPLAFANSYVQMSVMAASVATMSIAYAMSAFGGDDEEEKKRKVRKALDSISEHEKAMYHIIFTGKMDKDGELEYYRIKKLPVASIATTWAEQIMYNYLVGSVFDEATFEESISKSIPLSISDIKSKNPVVAGLLTYYYDEDTFTGEKVFRGPKDKEILATAEGINDTKIEGFYKTIAPVFGLSPARSKAALEKIITNQSTNPTINAFYAAMNGIFDGNTTFAKEFMEAGTKMKEAAGKKLIRFTNESVIKYKEIDASEKERMVINTDTYLKDSKIKAKIKETYKNGKTLTVGQLQDMVQKNFDPIDQKRYIQKYYTYTQTINTNPVLLDIIYEKDPNIQALLINDTYGSNLDREEMAELMDVMSRSRIKISKKAWYVYQEKYKNRK